MFEADPAVLFTLIVVCQVLSMLHDTGKLQAGIVELLDAAAARFTPEDQQEFLDAVLFGKAFVNRYRTFDPQSFKKNAAEVAKVGL